MPRDPAINLGTTSSYDGMEFWISPHVHVCVTSEGSVLLDLKRNKYLGIGKEETEILAAAVAGWPRPIWSPTLHGDALAKARVEELCASMLGSGQLIRAPEGWRSSLAVPRRANMKADWIAVGDEIEVNCAVTWRHFMHFARAYSWARCSLAWRPFLATVQAVRSRKVGYTPLHQSWNIYQVAGMVDIFRRLRPLVFAAEGRCLLHALALIRFLSLYDFYPEWVIGVTTLPWGAHSWVQWGDYLLDTNPEKVCAYTPIMVV